MQINTKRQLRSVLFFAGFFIWLIINIRVEAGLASTFERAIDGLVGGTVLLVSIFIALRFFRCFDDGYSQV